MVDGGLSWKCGVCGKRFVNLSKFKMHCAKHEERLGKINGHPFSWQDLEEVMG